MLVILMDLFANTSGDPWSYALPIPQLVASNMFMTMTWYGHLGYRSQPLGLVILVSWGIAFVEYRLAVPANRHGYGVYSAASFETLQEVVTLIVFAGFSTAVLKEPRGWHHAVGFALITTGAGFMFAGMA